MVSAAARPSNGTPSSSSVPDNSTSNNNASVRSRSNGGQGQQVQFDVPTVSVNGARPPSNHGHGHNQGQARPRQKQQQQAGTSAASSSSNADSSLKAKSGQLGEENDGWGANFWVTLVDPQSGTPFYACPSTGQVNWDPPVGNFVLPPSPNGEWWELIDESRGGLAYYYHTKTNETVWERPQDAFVIPLAILQNSALCKRLSARYSQAFDPEQLKSLSDQRQSLIGPSSSANNNSLSSPSPSALMGRSVSDTRVQQANANGNGNGTIRAPQTPKRSTSDGPQAHSRHLGPGHTFGANAQLPTIPASPYQTEDSNPPSPKLKASAAASGVRSREQVLAQRKEAQRAQQDRDRDRESGVRGKGKGKLVGSGGGGPPQSLDGAASKFAFETTPPKKSALKSSLPNGASSPPTPVSPTFSHPEEGDRTLGPDMSFSPQATSSPSSKSASPSPTTAMFGPPPNLNLNLSIRTTGVGSGGLDLPGAARGSGRNSILPTPTSAIPPTPISPGSVVTTSSLASQLTSASLVASRAQAINRIYGSDVDIGGAGMSSKGDLSVKEGRKSMAVAGSVREMLRTHDIGNPVFDKYRTMELSPVKARLEGKPILLDVKNTQSQHEASSRFSTGGRPILPDELASDIQQFCQKEFARQYFTTHRTGFIFRKKVPVEKMMVWQKSPISTPLLSLNREHHKTAVKLFKVIQRVMGDRDRDRPILVRTQASDPHLSTKSSMTSLNQSTSSLGHGHGGRNDGMAGLLEEERWLLTEGLMHGELRDEVYCQVVKQLSGNPNPESVFRGWQLMCVLLVTFPPSKNFEEFLRPFIRQHTQQAEGRVDIMAKYCLQRLSIISKKGPRGKAPTAAEIETASDAAFNPSTFGEPLDAIIRLQERNYPHLCVPIILPFLADGILALGGMSSEGIFRIPGDGDAVSDLKIRIERGYYNLEGVHDPHVPASLLKLWLRELCDPLVPTELYNDCVACARDPDACVRMVSRLPTYHRRVVLFVVSFLQLFLDDRVQQVTKMTSANLALVMAPNLLRCDSESMTVVFTNAPYEQMFVHNLLVHLRCGKVDPGYVPKHGLGAVVPPGSSQRRRSKSRTRKGGR